MIRAILFDMGNVLIHFDHDRMCRQIGEVVGWSGEEVRRMLMDSGAFDRYESSRISMAQMQSEVAEMFGRAVSRDELWRAVSDIFWRNESIEPVVDELVACGFPLVLVSNVSDAHIRWLEGRMPVLRHFRRRVLSFEVEATKPASAIFQVAAEVAGVPPAECFFTDDTPGHIGAAPELGFDAVVYRDTPSLVRELQSRGIPLFAKSAKKESADDADGEEKELEE